MATPDAPKVQTTFPLIPKIINGGIAGLIGVSCVFPLDLVKTRLQNQTIGPNGEKQYKNMFDCFRKTVASEGYFGMYRGSLINILLITPEKSIKLAVNDFIRYLFRKPDGSILVRYQALAGAGAGLCQILITTPMELLKIAMQDQGRVAAEAKSKGLIHDKYTVSSLIKKLGPSGLYKGGVSTVIRDVTFNTLYFPLFAALCRTRYRDAGELTFWWSFISGMMAGAIAAFVVNPADVVKTRLQTLSKPTSDQRVYYGYFDCVMKIFKYEGFLAFFKGGGCRIMVIAPLFAIVQMVYYIGIGEFIMGMEKYNQL